METLTPTFTADKTPMEMLEIKNPTWCIMTFAAGVLGESEVSVNIPPAWGGGAPCFGHVYDTNKNACVVYGNDSKNKWEFNLAYFGE